METQPSFFRLAWRSGLCAGGLLFVLLGGIFASMGGAKLVAELRCQREGVRVEGTILSKSFERASGGKSSTSYLVSYRFATRQGVTVEASDEVDVDQWEELKKGDPFEIVYLPNSPKSNRGVGTSEMPLALAFTGVGVFTLVIGAGLFVAGVRAAARQLRICRNGVALVLLLVAATCGCRGRTIERPGSGRVVIGGLSFSLPEGFVRKAYERSREQVLDIPGHFTDQVFASWEGPGEQSFCLFYWSLYAPRDLGPMLAAKQWKTRIAGQETEAVETEMFMGYKQRVLVTWLERPGGGGRFMMYSRNIPRETFDKILATMSF